MINSEAACQVEEPTLEESTLAWPGTRSSDLDDAVPLPNERDFNFLDFGLEDAEPKTTDWVPTMVSFGALQDQSNELDQLGTLTPLVTTAPPLPKPRILPGSQITHRVWPQSPSIPMMPSYTLRSFARSRAAARFSPTATLMTHILTSYPRMMYTPSSLPPFIHPYSMKQSSHNHSSAFESLSTCVSLTQMASSQALGARKLFWKNVRLECERLQCEVRRQSSTLLRKGRGSRCSWRILINGDCCSRCKL